MRATPRSSAFPAREQTTRQLGTPGKAFERAAITIKQDFARAERGRGSHLISDAASHRAIWIKVRVPVTGASLFAVHRRAPTAPLLPINNGLVAETHRGTPGDVGHSVASLARPLCRRLAREAAQKGTKGADSRRVPGEFATSTTYGGRTGAYQ